ncbi:hypothetical protein WMY93_031484 [Mugilogobius chulae]|uniref:Thrombospondin type 1 domain containing 7A n=1 Tax=Mugilogobius chulae TaxID=88201 RepID=A0AAW0MFT7_9GOBI
MGSDCGPGGSQSRAVWCAHVDGWTTLHTNCEQSVRPSNQRNCFRVCDWHRDLYGWSLGAWNSCVPVVSRSLDAPPALPCSGGEEGLQTREVRCVLKSDESSTEDSICEYFEPKPRLEQACLIPCPQDCVVSEYSPGPPALKPAAWASEIGQESPLWDIQVGFQRREVVCVHRNGSTVAKHQQCLEYDGIFPKPYPAVVQSQPEQTRAAVSQKRAAAAADAILCNLTVFCSHGEKYTGNVKSTSLVVSSVSEIKDDVRWSSPPLL